MTKKKVALIYSEEFVRISSLLPYNLNRSLMVHSLIIAYGLHSTKLLIVPPIVSDFEELMEYHSEEYLNCLQRVRGSTVDESIASDFGLRDDCAVFDELWEYCCFCVGGSLTAASVILEGKADVVINWEGGRHHAKYDKASGFCYVNDVIFCILRLVYSNSDKRSTVLYVDLDIHHGDGVEAAFESDPFVYTCSFHLLQPHFFPGTGKFSVSDSKCNVNLPTGITDSAFIPYVVEVLDHFKDIYDHVVLCVGVDGLRNDTLTGIHGGGWKLTPKSYTEVLRYLGTWESKLIVLGGGGYNNKEVSKCWTMVTAALVEEKLSNDIPEHEFIEVYWPMYQLDEWDDEEEEGHWTEEMKRQLMEIRSYFKERTRK